LGVPVGRVLPVLMGLMRPRRAGTAAMVLLGVPGVMGVLVVLVGWMPVTVVLGVPVGRVVTGAPVVLGLMGLMRPWRGRLGKTAAMAVLAVLGVTVVTAAKPAKHYHRRAKPAPQAAAGREESAAAAEPVARVGLASTVGLEALALPVRLGVPGARPTAISAAQAAQEVAVAPAVQEERGYPPSTSLISERMKCR
jgi:hypothetical protein